ncbi:bifunctional preprotein translocase subunit SecD/SecF [Posidoniimonas polymericola]|uniref:Multifunctional fusion protein n=1 Tax=Posidoniimonas polymericola TaxID=2528002 RepID=A0A5C5YRA7_9BACT|nr:protein translocase subunit SecD [Posidoniimonas polymericola]TWT77368.1 bifunctional preprotein translocase subunit SecD/SecF [Posidoniimonas polymericola]
MRHTKPAFRFSPFARAGLLACLLAALMVSFAAPQAAYSQDEGDAATAEAAAPADEAPAGEEAASEEPAADATDPAPAAEDSGTAEPAEEATTEDPAAEEANAAATDAEGDSTTNAAAGGATLAGEEAAGFDWANALLIIAVLVVPVVVGNWLAGVLKMPDHGWKLALVLTSVAVGGLIVATGTFKGGTDLSGGTTLVYEIADKDRIIDENNPNASAPEESGEGKQKVKIDQVINALKMRVDPSGTKEVAIRSYGDDIEVIVPQASSQDELKHVKAMLTDLGELEFRILASAGWPNDKPVIDAAMALPPSQKSVEIGGQERGRWVQFDEREFGDGEGRLVTRQTRAEPEALVLIDPLNVTGEYLTSARSDFDETGRPAVGFRFDARGSARFGQLTGDNLPNASGRQRSLAIILDEKILSAPGIKSRITSNGQISGGSMTKQEVERIVAVLDAGSLPAALNKTPISEETISATIGVKTIEQGKFAISVSLIAVLIFIVIYYRFAGLVACLALAINMLLVLALMVLFGAAFTLPGLAGLVLTVGMSVDANVLIFERIREEMARGAALRMAIRNGFDRATTTIVDANVTTLITGVVLYAIGTDQIRGFAVTLILGILMSMYSAIFCSRLVFDIAERKRWIKSLSFSQIIGDTSFDFIGKRGMAAVFSIALIAIGLFSVFGRGSGILDIDFTGGASVTQVLAEGVDMGIAEVRDTVAAAQVGEETLGDKNLTVTERGEGGKRFTVRSSVEDVDSVKQALTDAFGDKLLKNSVAIGEVNPFTEGGFEGSQVELTFNQGDAYSKDDGFSHDVLEERIAAILADKGAKVAPVLENPEYVEDSSLRFKDWTLKLQGQTAEQTRAVAEDLQQQLAGQPIFPLANKIGGKVAGGMQRKAIQAIVVSLLGIIAYVWFRFQNIAFGLAAVVALVHDVLVTLGAIAISAYLVNMVPALAEALQIQSFQISLTVVAAFLTIIGYSLNDTIVIFDRVREVRGKSPKLTFSMVNTSINQTLSRTVLTSLTTLLVVILLYFFGGPGIHSFAFALVVGVIVGTYSTIFIACPALLSMVGASPDPAAKSGGSSGGSSSSDAA